MTTAKQTGRQAINNMPPDHSIWGHENLNALHFEPAYAKAWLKRYARGI